MIVRCGVCTKRYHLDDEVVGSKGQSVRCTACGHIWHQVPLPASMNPILTLPVSLPVSADPSRFFLLKRICWAIFLMGLSVVSVIYVKEKYRSTFSISDLFSLT